MVWAEIAWTFLKANWKWIAVALAISSLVGYIEVIKLERNHYKKQYQDIQLQLDTVRKDSKAKQDQLQADANAITSKYRSALTDANILTTENAKLNAQNIAKDKELTSVKLSLNAIRLFNASKSTDKDSVANTEQGNDGTSASLAKALEEKSQSLADLLQVVNINDANHLKCIATVEQWQKFWSDYAASVETINAGQH